MYDGTLDDVKDGVIEIEFGTSSHQGTAETNAFEITISAFRPGGGTTIVSINTHAVRADDRAGSGTAVVDDRGGNGASVRVNGQSKDGVKVEARVDCGNIGR